MPEPRKQGESEKDFISRCMSEIKDEYPDNSQRYAVCKSYSDKKEQKMKQEELFVLQPRKAENRGTYLTRCSAHPKMKTQFKNLKERMGFCLSSFNEYYKYWAKMSEDMAEVPEDTTLGACIAKEKAKGFDYKEAYAHCASRVGTKPLGPGQSIVLEEEINVYGFRPKHFDMCPKAVELFKHFSEMKLDEDTVGMVRSAALVADRVFEIEKMVIDNGTVDNASMEEAVSLVEDFKDIIHEVDEATGMVHDSSFMDGHIEKIKSYMEMSDDLLVEPVMFANAISIDFDDTLSTPKGKELAMKLIDAGEDLHIITRRNKNDSGEVFKVAEEVGIPKEKIHFTEGKMKWEMIKELGVKVHIDNNSEEIKAIKENIPDVETIKFS